MVRQGPNETRKSIWVDTSILSFLHTLQLRFGRQVRDQTWDDWGNRSLVVSYMFWLSSSEQFAAGLKDHWVASESRSWMDVLHEVCACARLPI